MSWDQQAYSFGNPNAQPPTPSQTPTSGQFPSPTFQTPRNNSGFDDRTGWTPTFAEEYSVFNSTPGRLTSNHHQFVDDRTPHLTADPPSNRRLSNAGDIAAELATHVHHFSPNPSLSLPPVDPSNQLPSSPGLYPATHGQSDDNSTSNVTPRKPKKRLEEISSGQTATPPATASRGSRKLAPRLSTNTMQNDALDSQYGGALTPTPQPNLINFPSSSAEFFNYPMSAPAAAPTFNAKTFWDADASMDGMDLDFGVPDDASMFNMDSHKVSNSFDWGRSNQMFQDTVNLPPPSEVEQTTKAVSKRQRPLAPKGTLPSTVASTSQAPFESSGVSASGDPFSSAAFGGAVDPGLLFSRSTSKISNSFEDTCSPAKRPFSSHPELQPYSHQMRESKRDEEELRLSRTRRESKGRRLERGTVSSPVRNPERPGLQRSISENRGRRLQENFIPPSKRRGSPVKLQRANGLASIPERLQYKTEVRFVIDERGRARTENVAIGPEAIEPRSLSMREDGESSLNESSTDEDDVILPSQNTSFALPTQQRGTKLSMFDTSHLGAEGRRHSTSLSGYSQSESSRSSQRSLRRDSIGSEAETVVDDNDGSGDAANAIRRVMESRKQSQMKKPRNPQHHRLATDTTPRGNTRYWGSHMSSTNLSPTSATTRDGKTSFSARSSTTRCVCNNPESEGFMIQCESCDNWLHGRCVQLDRQSLPPVYICAFCARTPNMRGGRLREPPKNTQTGSSPLAHKSFMSFR